MAVIRAEDHVPRIQTFFGDRGDLAFDIVPCTSKADHGPHALPHPRDGVSFAGPFVIVRRPARDIGGKGRPQVG